MIFFLCNFCLRHLGLHFFEMMKATSETLVQYMGHILCNGFILHHLTMAMFLLAFLRLLQKNYAVHHPFYKSSFLLFSLKLEFPFPLVLLNEHRVVCMIYAWKTMKASFEACSIEIFIHLREIASSLQEADASKYSNVVCTRFNAYLHDMYHQFKCSLFLPTK